MAEASSRGAEWYSCVREARPFRELAKIPEPLRIPRWFVGVLVAVVALGVVLGLLADGSLGFRAASAAFQGSLYAYLAVSLLDLWEHFRLEHYVSGRWLSSVVVPRGESALHGAIVATLVAILTLARPLPPQLELRDWFVLIGPIGFVALGWADELVYHRRRALHREDMLHTVSHLAAAAMLVSIFAAKVVDWG